jgi:hypothetical protein
MSTRSIMNYYLKTQFLSLVLFLLLILSSLPVQAQRNEQGLGSFSLIPSDEIIQRGIEAIRSEQNPRVNASQRQSALVTWFNKNPSIDYASGIERSITVRFIDGSYVVLLDPFSEIEESVGGFISPSLYQRYPGRTNKTSIILNPAESMYGHHQCQRIITTLLNQDYSVEYLANQAVDVSYIRNNLSATIIYMNTHAGYFDVDGDTQADAVVIATGELWTNQTDETYASEIENHLIVKGMVGDQGFVTFTPGFIAQYYSEKQFPGSLVYMATCYALYDTTMAQAFLDAGAKVYMGWSQNTVFWTNSRTSVQAFHLLSCGLTVHMVCRLIRSGGFYNWLFHSKLMYVGDGTYTIP